MNKYLIFTSVFEINQISTNNSILPAWFAREPFFKLTSAYP